jgi:phosphate uptake regulator
MAMRAVKVKATGNQFNNLLVTMGLQVDEAVGKAIAALLHSNSHIVADVMESSVAIQDLELKLDHAVFSALEQGELPRWEDRRMTSIVNISKDLARLGKLAANLGRKVTEVGKHNEHEDFSRLQPLAIAVSHLCRQTLRSLPRQDLVLAHSAAVMCASVAASRDYLMHSLNGSPAACRERAGRPASHLCLPLPGADCRPCCASGGEPGGFSRRRT